MIYLKRLPCILKHYFLQVTDQGKIKRVRGVVWAVRVSPATANRVVESAKGVLLKVNSWHGFQSVLFL